LLARPSSWACSSPGAPCRNREGQITERFTSVIDQLGKAANKGSKLFEIRVGGIYALERIARESDLYLEPLEHYKRRNEKNEKDR
jgi:hypothetical protein